jgi:hypothetical protein
MNTLNPIEAVIPKAREARARFLQRASRAEESAPLPLVRGTPIVPHLRGFYALMGNHTASFTSIPQRNVNAIIGICHL